MEVTQLTIKDQSISPAKLANFLKKNIDPHLNLSIHYFLELAKKMIAGDIYTHDYDLEFPDNDFVSVSLVDVIEQEEKSFKCFQAQLKYYNSLLEKGVNGDAQAAIEFCKAFNDGKYKIGPFA